MEQPEVVEAPEAPEAPEADAPRAAAELQETVPETPAPKKRGRPSGSKNRAPDMYTVLLDRMTSLEQSLQTRAAEPPPRPETVPDAPRAAAELRPETPPKRARVTRDRPAASAVGATRSVKRAPRARAPSPVQARAPPLSAAKQLMETLRLANQQRRQQQLDFYQSFLPR